MVFLGCWCWLLDAEKFTVRSKRMNLIVKYLEELKHQLRDSLSVFRKFIDNIRCCFWYVIQSIHKDETVMKKLFMLTAEKHLLRKPFKGKPIIVVIATLTEFDKQEKVAWNYLRDITFYGQILIFNNLLLVLNIKKHLADENN